MGGGGGGKVGEGGGGGGLAVLCARLPRPAEESHLGLFGSRCREITYLLIGNEGLSPAGRENAEVFYHTCTRAHMRTPH